MEAEGMNVEELKAYALKRGLNLGQAEKDYYQNILLFILYQNTGNELVFKGGTALAKCYGLNRFSEDLDFSASERKDYVKIIRDGIDSFGIRHALKRQTSSEENASFMVTMEGPLYKGSEKTLCSVTVEMSFRERAFMEPRINTIGHHMDITPVFDVYVMQEEEIMAEKTRAIMMRTSGRDLYDVCFLIANGVKPKREIINKKLRTVGLKFEYNSFAEKCRETRKVWDSELSSLVRNVPDFSECLEKALEAYSVLK